MASVSLLDRVARALPGASEKRSSIDQYISGYLIPSTWQSFVYGDNTYPVGVQTSYGAQRAMEIAQTLPAFFAALQRCPPAFAAQMLRATVLSQARFTFRNRPGGPNSRRTFGTRALSLLEKPWTNGTTGDLLTRMEWHAGLAGNAYVTDYIPGRLRVLRPDWTAILYGSQRDPDDPAHAIDGEVIGYVYQNGGLYGGSPEKMVTLSPSEVAHWSPIPDPLNAGIGMSWLTPAIREIQGDVLATEHKIRFFENGAPQPLRSRILTPTGWSTMGEIHPGAQVVGSDGKPHTVLAVYPQGERDIYRVTFSSGAQVECTEDHLWSVASAYDRKLGVTRTMPLRDIAAAGATYASGPARWSVPLVAPVEYEPGETLSIDPYLLGSLLGDGCLRGNSARQGSASLACHSADVDEQITLLAPLVPAGTGMKHRNRRGKSSEIYLGGGTLTGLLRDLGLWGLLGHDKFIPDRYMRASVNERVALLQGLIDTDGSIDGRQPNTVRFDNTSEALCRQLGDLVGGLGGIATVRPSRNVSGNSRAQWRVTISRLPEWITPCRLARKAERYRPTLRGGAYRYIQRIEPAGRSQAQCIAVDSDDHLYVTDGFVLTHNTPNLVVKGITAADKTQFDAIVDMMEEKHAGVANAYKTLYLTAGADATVVGSDLQQIDFKQTQGAGETRLSMLSRVHPVILGTSEGLGGSSLNAGNFGQARRMWGDTWIFPTLQDVCQALEPLVPPPPGAELWFDTADMPILREDAKDAAQITQIDATTIATLVKEGFTPESVITAVKGQDMTLLKHTGLLSVQLQVPGGPQGLPPDVAAARNLVEMIQKVYLGVDVVLTEDEARELLNRAGADLPIPGPALNPPPSAPAPGGP